MMDPVFVTGGTWCLFASTNPSDYEAGFPLHPHRGIETVTYLLNGVVLRTGA